MPRQKKESPDFPALTPEDAAAINNADEAGLRRTIEEAATAEMSVKAAMDVDSDVQAAKTKLKEVTAGYKEDMKRERQRRQMAYHRLEHLGKVE